MQRNSWITIDLDAITHNFKAIKRNVGKDIKIFAIVKADAYGHGAVEVSKVLARNGVDMLGVAFLYEAIELLDNNIDVPILILNPILPEEIEHVLKHSLSVTVSNPDAGKKLSEAAKKNRQTIKIHVELDTGMGSVGVHPDNALSLIKALSLSENLKIEGIFTHFHSSEDRDKSFTRKQIGIFKNVLKQLEIEGINIPIIHAANSAAILEFPDTYFNMVRPGLVLYGIYPADHTSCNIGLKPVMGFMTKIINLKHLDAGSTVGYSRSFKVERASKVATIPVGYKDGFSRHFSNKGKVLINGGPASIIGRVCMDRCFVDVTHLPGVKIGNEVVLFGRQENETISIASSAKLINTIPYEITCNIGMNVPKTYRKK